MAQEENIVDIILKKYHHVDFIMGTLFNANYLIINNFLNLIIITKIQTRITNE